MTMMMMMLVIIVMIVEIMIVMVVCWWGLYLVLLAKGVDVDTVGVLRKLHEEEDFLEAQ